MKFNRPLGENWFSPGWALDHTGERETKNPTGTETRTSFQRPSGRDPLMATLSGGRVSKATLATGYSPAPIRAKTNSE